MSVAGRMRVLLYRILGNAAASRVHGVWRTLAAPFRSSMTPGDRRLLEEVRTLVTRGQAVLDIGAHNGSWSRALAPLTGGEGLVIAFEPVPANLAVLVRKTSRAGNVVCRGTALSDADGTGVILLPPDTCSPSTGAMTGTADHLRGAGSLRRLEVRTERIDSVVPGLLAGRRLALVKCDVEGHELQVLEGGLSTLREHRPAVILEILREKWTDGDPRASGSARLLSSLGYAMRQVTVDGLIDGANGFRPDAEDFLFLPGPPGD